MANVIGGMTLSLDGFAADEHGDASALYPDLAALAQSEVLQEEIRSTGAIIMGRRSYAMADDPDFYAESYEYQVPIFVVTHVAPLQIPKSNDRLTIHFVTNGIESAVAQAKAAAGARNVLLIGATINRQCLNADLCDELHMGCVPVLLGNGLRLFDGVDATRFSLERYRLFEAGARTDIWYRVVRRA